VPVGKDQLPHLELTREVIRRFNHLYNTDVMTEPGEVLTKVQKLKGTDGRKMSKSYGNTIYLTEEKASLKKKVNKMVTDPARIRVDDKGHPEVCSVFSYQKIFNQNEAEKINNECKSGTIGCVKCKKKLLNNLNDFIQPIREKYLYYKENTKKVNKILEDGNRRAKKTASENLKLFRKEMNYG
jgi:tryptophanyl-tRNA synthetase